MNCGEVNGLLDRLMDGELSDEQRRALEAHGQACPECAEAIRATVQLKALFSQMEPEVDVPLEAQAKWRGAVREAAKARRGRRLTRWVATAAAAVVALVGVGAALNLRGAPQRDAVPAPMASPEPIAQIEAAYEAEEAVADGAYSNGADAYQAAEYALADGAVVEADGAAEEEELLPNMAGEPGDGLVEFKEAAPEAMCAALAQRAPACELDLRVEDVDAACAHILDLAEEYEASADVQTLEDGGANIYVEIDASDAEAFLSALTPLDTSGQSPEVPELEGEGTALLLLTVKR